LAARLDWLTATAAQTGVNNKATAKEAKGGIFMDSLPRSDENNSISVTQSTLPQNQK
jgi:hypothetical protein